MNLPYSKESEQALLGCILVDNDSMLEVGKLTSEMFFVTKHCSIFAKMSDMIKAGKSVDIITLSQRFEELGELDNIGGYSYLAELSTCCVSSSHAKSYAESIIEDSLKRNILEASEKLKCSIHDGENKALEILEEFNHKTNNLTQDIVEDEILDSNKLSSSYFEHYNKRREQKENGGVIGIPTGFDRVSIDKGEMMTICALPKQGKSMLAVNIAMNASLTHKVVFFSFEMNHKEIMNRVLSIILDKEIKQFKNVELNDNEIAEGLDILNTKYKNLKIYDKATTIEHLETIIKREHLVSGIDLCVVDYIQRTQTKKQLELVQKTIQVTSSLKSIALNHNVAMIPLSQFNREGSKRGLPTSNDIFGGESVKQDSDQIWILHNGTLVEDGQHNYDPVYILRKTHDRNDSNLGDIYVERKRGYAKFYDSFNALPPAWIK
jgi:replicative DNA helicase